jgi:uncharacterized protein YciI
MPNCRTPPLSHQYLRCGSVMLSYMFSLTRNKCKGLGVKLARSFSTANTKLFVLEYHYVENMLEKRIPFRGAHLEYANKFVADKILLAGGALVPDVVKGVLLLRAADIDTVQSFATNDPYVKNGLVKKLEVSEWAVAVGGV